MFIYETEGKLYVENMFQEESKTDDVRGLINPKVSNIYTAIKDFREQLSWIIGHLN